MNYVGLILNGSQPVAGKECKFEGADHAILIVVGLDLIEERVSNLKRPDEWIVCDGELQRVCEAIGKLDDRQCRKTRSGDEKIRGPGTLKECHNAEFSTNSYILEPFWKECQPS